MNQPDDPGVDDVLLRRPDEVLIPNWRAVLKKAWSVRLIVLAVLLTGLETVLELFGYRLPLSDFAQAFLVFVVTVAALLARIIAQKGLSI